MPSWKPDCECAPRRNAAQEPHRKPRNPFSAVRFARRIIAKYGRFLRISNEEAPTFSAFQTGWRRGRDSNPRYPFGYAGFQDRSHQPLGHLSATYNSTSALRTIELPVDGLHLR